MTASVLASLGALPGWNLSLLLLLAKATIILLAALGITLAMQRASATARHFVWLVTLGTVLLVPALTAWAPLRLGILPPAQALHAVDRGVAGGAAPFEVAPISSTAPNVVPSHRAPSGSLSVLGRLPFSMAAVSGVSLVLAIWGAVMLAIVARLVWASLAVRRIMHDARPLESSDWLTPLFEIADRIGLETPPRLLQSDEAKMPFACGISRPTIVLPADSDDWTLARRRAVLLHELAHVRRHDLLGHTLGRLACAVYWFHPLVWTAAKHLRSESERACDDVALACGTRATDYAEHLLDIVTSVRGDSTPLVALAMARRKEFEGRMLAILDPHLRHSTPSRRQSALLIGSLALISLTVGATAPVARQADAAAVAATVQHNAGARSPALRGASRAAPTWANAHLDSGQLGDSSASVSSARSTITSMRQSSSRSTLQSTSQSTSQSTREVRQTGANQPESTAEAAVVAIAQAGAQYGLNVASSVLLSMGQDPNVQGEKGAKGGKGPDDRPVLLARVLKSDTSASLRRIAAWGLQQYARSPIAGEALANAIEHDADWRVREMAAWSLGQGDGGTANVTDALQSALKRDANERVRATAAWALGDIGDRTSVDGLAAALADPAASVRERAAWALGNVSPKQAPKALVRLLADKDARVRTLAAWALYNIEDPSTAPAIESALRVEQNKEVQRALIRSIAALGENSLDALRGLLESSDPQVKSMAVHALASGHAAGPWPWPWPEPRPFP